MFKVIEKKDGDLYCIHARPGDTIQQYTRDNGERFLLRYSGFASWGEVWNTNGCVFRCWTDLETDTLGEYLPNMTENILIDLFEKFWKER